MPLPGPFHFLVFFQTHKAHWHIYQFGEHYYFQSSRLLFPLHFLSHPGDVRFHIKWLGFCYHGLWWQVDALFVWQWWFGKNTLQKCHLEFFVLMVVSLTKKQFIHPFFIIVNVIAVHTSLLSWCKCLTFASLLTNPQVQPQRAHCSFNTSDRYFLDYKDPFERVKFFGYTLQLL